MPRLRSLGLVALGAALALGLVGAVAATRGPLPGPGDEPTNPRSSASTGGKATRVAVKDNPVLGTP
jgi:hypothetical protein